MKRWVLLFGLMLLGFSTQAVQGGDTPDQKEVRTSTASAHPPARPAWQFTDDERFALRTDAALARERVAERRQRGTTGRIHTASIDRQQPADSFDGKTHPELFLPHEVFAEFVKLAFEGDARMREVVRHGMAADVRKAGFPPDFWGRLDALIAFHVADLRAERDLLASRSRENGPARRRIEESLDLKRADVCHGRAKALAAARASFGRERFDRFLYEAVAVNMFYLSDRIPTTAELRRWEGGCR